MALNALNAPATLQLPVATCCWLPIAEATGEAGEEEADTEGERIAEQQQCRQAFFVYE